MQVLDRWHVLKNLREAVEHDLLRKQPEIIKLFAANENELAPARRYGKEYIAHQAAVARRQSQHQQVHTLHAQGTDPEDIAKRVKVSLSTVYRIRRQDHPPEPVRLRKQASVLDRYLPYLQQRWAEGCTVAQELFPEVQQQGYRGSVGRVRSWLRQRRHLPADVGVPSAAPIRTTAKALSWLLFREQASLNAGEEDTLQTLITAFPEFAQLRCLTAGFRQALKDKKVEGLRIWRKEVGDSDLPHLRQFSHRLGNEWAELEAACLLPYSNGPTEGVVNRVKMVKRQMFGRGSFNLLRKRILLAA